ncbi:MAG: MdtA/MuxA family multidrug efflux RND transporter periplasmic adaptor subunit [Lautropia sp.]
MRPSRLVLLSLLVAALAAGGYFAWKTWFAPPPDTAARAGSAAPAGARPAGGGGAQGRSGRRGRPEEERPIPVLASTLRNEDVDIVLNALGTVTARSTVTVRPRVDGQLVRLAFDEGQVVQKGQLLAEIDPRPFEVQLAQAQGQLARDRAQLQNAQKDLERYRGLLRQDSIAKQQVDTQEALVNQLKGTIAAGQSQVDSAKLQLSFTRITAPVGGRAGLRQVDVGNMVRATDPNGLVVINEVQPIAVVFSVPSDEIAEVAASLRRPVPPVVEAWDRANLRQLAVGRLTTLDNQIDPATGTIKLKAEFANADSALFPNQFVNVRLRVRTIEGALVMPTAAVQRSSAGTYVFAVGKGNRIEIRKVVLGVVQEDLVVVREGLAAGDRVVIDGADRVRERALVEPVMREQGGRAPANGGPANGGPASGGPAARAPAQPAPDAPAGGAPAGRAVAARAAAS